MVGGGVRPPYGHAGHEAGDVIRRPPKQAICQVGDGSMPEHAPLEIVPCLRAQVVDGMAVAVFLVGHGLTLRRVGLHVVEPRDRAHSVTKRGMPRDVLDPFVPKVDNPPVPQRLHMLFACLQHHLPPSLMRMDMVCQDGRLSQVFSSVPMAPNALAEPPHHNR